MSDTPAELPTIGQLERALSQQLSALFVERLGHRPERIICQIAKQQVSIVMENSIAPAVQLLSDESDADLAENVRDSLDEALRPHISNIVQDCLQVDVTDLMSDATLETGRTGIIAILAAMPHTRPTTR